MKPLIARRGTEHGSGLGAQRWFVERAFAHLHWFRRLRIRWEIWDDIHEALLALGCAPAVGEWLRRGVGPDRIVAAVRADLPGPILRRPAGLIAYRLGHLKPVEAAPLPSPQGQRPNVVPMQNCDACDRGYRAERPGMCRDCATASAAA